MRCPKCGKELIEVDIINDDAWRLNGITEKQREIVLKTKIGYKCSENKNNAWRTRRHKKGGFSFLLINKRWYIYHSGRWNKFNSRDLEKEKVVFT